MKRVDEQDPKRALALLLLLVLASLMTMSVLQETMTTEAGPLRHELPDELPDELRHELPDELPDEAVLVVPSAEPAPSPVDPALASSASWVQATLGPKPWLPTDKAGDMYPVDPAGKIKCVALRTGHLVEHFIDPTDCYTEDDRREMIRALVYTLIDAFDAHGIEYWLDSGTLLGSVRHGGLIPHDLDADFGLTHASFEQLRRTNLTFPSRYELFVNDSRFYRRGPYAYLPGRFTDTTKGLYIDLFEFLPSTRIEPTTDRDAATATTPHGTDPSTNTSTHLEATTTTTTTTTTVAIEMLGPAASNCWWACKNCPEPMHFLVPRDVIFPLVRCKFDDRMAWCPRQATEYLQVLYGNDFMTLKHSAS
ncbi:hypothetical protein SPRG_07871 [Saprolegnia parasitica CBS 223.65]|uniref:LicD/FKTN/FKRP nucleotidyltransferase domain-containing protein n=1 Tax=Saprolegnia parasitica (strain CBS 223.65) TaxID=695850 RepID=A0A067CDE5_SAPPC|nr:hypothetical protein SPRG_07871 [Saprolegnia parasitica CBS 223.65]KDO27165.1 hypothetical protein SPRG_07871 [Saprolegnia parasitica CBS 223.65]|eukprot:XP_012202252.1 hypothetical protein SPRG_07871 [Saprolegnia parasitica CBS 223.65]